MRHSQSDPGDTVRRFTASLAIDHDKWHDGVGYDLDAITRADEAERGAIEALLLRRGINDWRDVEALAALDTPRAQQALRDARDHADHAIRLAIGRYAPHLLDEDERTTSLVQALETGELYGGLSQALDEVEEFHPPAVIDALFRGARHREGEVAVNFAAMLMFLHGKADSAFDWELRPFFLRFHAPPGPERDAVFDELCARLEVSHAP